MNLPRVIVAVEARPEAESPGWTVTVTGHGINQSFPLERATVAVGDRNRVVPVRGPAVPEGLGDRLARIDARRTDPGDVREYGRWLFDCLLEPVWDKIRRLEAVTNVRGVELALRWAPTEIALHGLTWEAMSRPDNGGDVIPLAGDPELLVAITRLVPVAIDGVETVTRTPRVLFAAGSSLFDEVIRPGAMFMGLLRAFDAAGICSAKAVENASSEVLETQCAQFEPDVVHILAHGEIVGGQGVLRLAGEPVTADALAVALTQRWRPLTVVLSACRTGLSATDNCPRSGPVGPLAAQLVARGIPIVSAMAGEVSELACRLYTRRLVDAVSSGVPLAEAAAQGRRAALQHTLNPTGQLDWAMPSLFMAESVPVGFRAVDQRRSQWLVDAATNLGLRRYPVFIGRAEILRELDNLLLNEGPMRLAVIGAVHEGPIAGLGGTRLLREMGYQLLLRGHLPVLLGPYGEGQGPTDLRQLIARLWGQVSELARHLEFAPPRFVTLREHYPADADFGDPYEARRALLAAVDSYAQAADELPARLTEEDLRADLTALAEAVGRRAEPFGPHTRVVVLADEVHHWGALGALTTMLGQAGLIGLGTNRRPAPVVFTGSFARINGPALKQFCDAHRSPGYAFPQLAVLTPHEALVGFQWVLLNPWRREEPPGPASRVYAAKANSDQRIIQSCFAVLGDSPAVVDDPRFYLAAELLKQTDQLVAGDDTAAWTGYLQRQPS